MIRFLDIAYVSKDERGVFHRQANGIDLGVGPALTGAVVWGLLEGHGFASSLSNAFRIFGSGDIGLDLDDIEGLPYRIHPGTSALLVLAEPCWANHLLAVTNTVGGSRIASGFLQPETMLILGPHLTRARLDVLAAERSAAKLGADIINAMRSGANQATTDALDTIRALVNAGVLDDADVPAAISALTDDGLVAPS